ncbi:hypothetical protein NliqN6_1494 [Naganishia liquefaciens]|uniref:SUI1 domain-containing protein n=1 Tax=Naganishia liquefaciens TaxID=104408 RepID=A0A8H3YEB8_9TREE|nr:hypothetical protein NliqN6_1494 [Naganishia liquefaciens]
MSAEQTTKVDATQAKKKLAPAGGMLNLNSRDPFADAETGGPSGAGTPIHEEPRGSDKIHIRIQQRNGRKMLTTVQGLGKEYDAKKVLKAFKKEFACNGTVVSSEDGDEEAAPEPSNKAKTNFGQVIQLQGDQRANVREFLISTGMVAARDAKEKIQVHGH